MSVPFTPLSDSDLMNIIVEAAHDMVPPVDDYLMEVATSAASLAFAEATHRDDLYAEGQMTLHVALIVIARRYLYGKAPFKGQSYTTVIDVPRDYITNADRVQWIAQDCLRVQRGDTICETYTHAHDWVIQSPDPREYGRYRAIYTRIPGATCTCMRCGQTECDCDTWRHPTLQCCNAHITDAEFEQLSREEQKL